MRRSFCILLGCLSLSCLRSHPELLFVRVPMTCKPPAKTSAPWASDTDSVTFQYSSTAKDSFCWHGKQLPIQKVIRQPQHDWDSSAPFEDVTTSRAAFRDLGGRPSISFKPKNSFKSTPSDGALTTTAKSHYVSYGHMPYASRQAAIVPPRAPYEYEAFTTRTTAQEAFAPFDRAFCKPRQNCRPATPPREHCTFDHVSTQKASYLAYKITPYKPASKPDGVFGKDGPFN